MVAWFKYVRERFPIIVYFILVSGFTLSGAGLSLQPLQFYAVIPFLGMLLFFFILRLMDEVKDYKKDLIANPTRPLPRGEIKLESALKAIHLGVYSMVLFGILTAVLFSLPAGIIYLILTAYLWLMYKEFYIGDWLANRVFLYGVSHQLILIILCAFSVVFFNSEMLFQPETYLYGLTVLGSFFSYEVCRKLDPNAHPLLRTYIHEYGYAKSFLIVLAMSSLAALSSHYLYIQIWLASLLVVTSFLILFVKPRMYKWVELVATLSLVIHIWSMAYIFLL